MNIDAIIPAAGKGIRFSKDVKKQFYIIEEHEILYYTLLKLKNAFKFKQYIIGIDFEDLKTVKTICDSLNIKNVEYCQGGLLRQHTVYNALLKSNADFVLVHDAVRPFVAIEVILKTIEAAEKNDFAICGLRLKDALKVIDADTILKSEDRSKFILTHTPQVAKRETLKEALYYANKHNIVLYDESHALEIFNKSVRFVESNIENIKITNTQDLSLAKLLLNNEY